MFDFTGTPVRAVRISENKYVGNATLAQLETAGLGDPSKIQSATKADIKGDSRLEDAHNLRGSIQRMFDSKRKTRGEFYSLFIGRCRKGELLGDTPPINIYIPGGVKYDEDKAVMSIPFGSTMIAIDGETQLYARYLLAERDPESKGDSFSVVFHVGISVEAAQQRLHDYNRYCKPVDETQIAILNHDGELTRGTNEALFFAGLSGGQIDRFGTKPRKGKEISIKQAQYGVTGAELGLQAATKPAKTWAVELNGQTAQQHINGAGSAFVSAFMKVPSDIRKTLTPDCVFVLGIIHKEKGEAAMLSAAPKVDWAFKNTKIAGPKKFIPIINLLVGV